MNTILLLEQSYMDSNISKFLMRHFNLQYGLKYLNNSYGNIPGNVGSLVGNFSEENFKKLVPMIVNDLQGYQPFLQFLGCFYKGYWFTKHHIDQINSYGLNSLNKIQISLNYYYPTKIFEQALNNSAYELIFLLNPKK